MPSFGQSTPKAQALWREGVNDERCRRIEEGTVVTLPGYGTVAIQGREEDLRNMTARYNVAAEKRAAGSSAADMVFRDRDNVDHMFTPQQMIDLYLIAQDWAEQVYKASWALKEGSVPRDYADAKHWP